MSRIALRLATLGATGATILALTAGTATASSDNEECSNQAVCIDIDILTHLPHGHHH